MVFVDELTLLCSVNIADLGMELSIIQSACFSKWVSTEKAEALNGSAGERKVYLPNIRYSEEELKELLHRWCKNSEKSPSTKLKLFIRQGIEPRMRCRVWKDACGGSESLASSPNFYHDVQEELGKQYFLNILVR